MNLFQNLKKTAYGFCTLQKRIRTEVKYFYTSVNRRIKEYTQFIGEKETARVFIINIWRYQRRW